MEHVGRLIILVGAVLVVVGIAVTLFDRLPWIGRLPGDLHWKRGNVHIYVPLMTSIVVSVVLTLLFWIFNHFVRR